MKEIYEQLALIDKKSARAQSLRIASAFNKKMKPRNLKKGDLVLKVPRDETFDPRGKIKPRWSGPFIIKKNHVKRCYKSYRFGWRRDASSNQHG